MLGKRIVLLALLTPDVPPHRLVDVLVHVTLQRHLQHVLAVPCRCCREGAAKYQRLCCMCARRLHFFRHVALCHSALRQRAVELLQVVRGSAGRRSSEQDTAARVPPHIPCRTRATPLHQLRYGGHAAAEATTARGMLEFGVSTGTLAATPSAQHNARRTTGSRQTGLRNFPRAEARTTGHMEGNTQCDTRKAL